MQRVLQGLRPYSAADIEAVTELLGESCAWPPPLPPTTQDLLWRWKHWNVVPGRDINILPAADDSAIAFLQTATSWRDARRVSMDIAVHPDYRGQGIGSALYDLALAHAHEQGANSLTQSIYISPGIDKTESIRFLTAREFRCTSRYWRLCIDDLAEVEAPAWPRGIECRVFRNNSEDAERWAHLIRVAFQEEATSEMVLAQAAEPESSPDGYFFAVDKETGVEVGTSRARRDNMGGEPVGYIGTVGVLPEYRGRGIAQSLIRQTLRYIASRSMSSATLYVEDGNKPALALYEKMGWYPLYRTDHYGKTLLPKDEG